MSVEIEGHTYPAIQLALDKVERDSTPRSLKALGHELVWSRIGEVRTRRQNGGGLVLTRNSAGDTALFVDSRGELVLMCRPAASYCPVCMTPAAQGRAADYGERLQFDCARCGQYVITRSAKAIFGNRRHDDSGLVAVLSYALRHMPRSDKWPLVDTYNLDDVLSTSLPTPEQQPGLLAAWLATESKTSGKSVAIEDPGTLAGIIGVQDDEGVSFIVSEMARAQLLTNEAIGSPGGGYRLTLTMAGWTLARETAERLSKKSSVASAPAERRAVILTALGAETEAVLRHLGEWTDEDVGGTAFHCGRFDDWDIAVTEVGAGNARAASIGARALQHFNPNVALFVGVAGGVKDVRIGDVVVATKIYGYESGKDTKHGFNSRPEISNTAHAIESRARALRRRPDWRSRLKEPVDATPPRIHIGPIAAGEKVVTARRSQTGAFLKQSYGDTLAVEMEGRGFLEAVHINAPVLGGVVRGISDLLAGKSAADRTGSQERAADAASAVAFEILATLKP